MGNSMTQILRVSGMTCASCQNKIETSLERTAGILHVSASYSKGTVEITYNTEQVSLDEATAVITKLDYVVIADNQVQSNYRRIAGIIIIIIALYILVKQMGLVQLFSSFPLAETGTGYGMLFVIGLLTSVHCVAMCGGINLSQCIPRSVARNSRFFSSLKPGFLYNLGRVISYTVIGAAVGALGSAIDFSGALKGAVQLLAGAFMIVMGLNMFGTFPWLRRLNPRLPKIFSRKIMAQKVVVSRPLYVGLLNGLMPCGPLQAMQLFALSTGSLLRGALSMFLFSIGTVPLMLGLGALSTVLSKKFTHKFMTAGAILVVVLGLSMLAQGASLSGFSFSSLFPRGSESPQDAGASIQIEDGIQYVNSTLSPGAYPVLIVQAGMPVKWTIDAPQGSINGCNNEMYIPEYGIEHNFRPGENIIEFTPVKTGNFPYSCWMGMIRSVVTVVEPDAAGPD